MPDNRFYTASKPLTLKEIIGLCQGEAHGNIAAREFSDVATLKNAGPKDVSFFHNKKYIEDLKTTKAGLVLLTPEFKDLAPQDTTVVVTSLPYRAFALVATALYPGVEDALFMHDRAISNEAHIASDVELAHGCVVMAGAKISSGTKLGPNCVIGPGVEIGSNCRLGANVSISHSILGDRVRIFPGVCIGQAGFGFAMDERGHISVPQLGRVFIQDDVEVGANATIDRGTLEDTIIGQGSRIDNLVQIGHGVQMGKNCVIVAQVGISGSTILGDFVIAAGQAGLTGHIQIGDGARIAAQAGVLRDVAKGEAVAGSPAVPVKQWHRQTVALGKLIQPQSSKAS